MIPSLRRVSAAAVDAAVGRAPKPHRLAHVRDILFCAAAHAAAGGCHLLWRPPHARQPRPEGMRDRSLLSLPQTFLDFALKVEYQMWIDMV